jgi:homocysteine S-methyltransferase
MRRTIEHATEMKALGADCINVGDSPMAEARMSAIATAALMKQRAEVEPIVHVSPRDRNLLALQSDLLGAHAWGLRNFLCIKGDAHSLGAYGDKVKPVWDINALDLMRVLKGFNAGHDVIEKPVGSGARFHVGAALNPGAADLEAEIKLARNKIRAGADFFLTQAVFDPAAIERALELLGPSHPPIIMGVWPLHSSRQCDFLVENKISSVPSHVRSAIVEAGDGAEQQGLELAHRLVESVRHLVQGVYFVPSFGRMQGIGELVAAARRLADGA